MKVATKTGDRGLTGLLSGDRLYKNHQIFHAVGNLDELSVFIGFCKVLDKNNFILLSDIQKVLINIMGELSYKDSDYSNKFPSLVDNDLEIIDNHINILQELPELQQKDWVLYGGSELGIRYDLASKVCRRAERDVVNILTVGIRPLILQYINRLSDFLYLYARKSDYAYSNSTE